MLARTEIVDEVLDEVIIEFEKEFGEVLTKADAFAIVANEFAMIPKAMEQGEDIELPFIGKFHDNTKAREEAIAKAGPFNRTYNTLASKAFNLNLVN